MVANMIFDLLQLLIHFSSLKYEFESNCSWSFGYGSNMDISHLKIKKNLTVYDYKPAILNGYKLSFNMATNWLAEPAFAGIIPDANSTVHGLAFCLPQESLDHLNEQEVWYQINYVNLETYDGEFLENVHVYVSPEKIRSKTEVAPSRRYLNIIRKGARNSGLKPDYLAKLDQIEPYQPSEEVLQIRQNRPKPSDLPKITVDQLFATKNSTKTWISVLGYIVESDRNYKRSGRDLTTRELMRYHDIPMDKNDDFGRPPYPIIEDLSTYEVDHLLNNLDAWHIKNVTTLELNPIVGYLKEFWDQQISGETDFRLPPRI